jgi:hypothetical protein
MAAWQNTILYMGAIFVKDFVGIGFLGFATPTIFSGTNHRADQFACYLESVIAP